MIVIITGSSGSYSADKSYNEIMTTIEAGGYTVATVQYNSGDNIYFYPMVSVSESDINFKHTNISEPPLLLKLKDSQFRVQIL